MRTVTVVDDEPAALDVLVRAARSWRYECQPAICAEQAIGLLEKRLTPIVVTDVRMPGRGGVWLVREIQRRWPDVAIIVVSAGQDDEVLAQCLEAGAQHYFLKPVKFAEFHHALETTLRTYHFRRQRRGLEHSLNKQTRKLRHTFLSAIDSLVRLVEARDPNLTGHSFRVRQYALKLADVLDLDRSQRRKLSLAAKLHDIGKVGLPECILNKPGPLTVEEFAAVKEHPVLAERILAPILRSPATLAAIRGHHERFDGTGYPDGLRGQEIPFLARVLTIADCYDALTSARAYRQAMPPAEALEIIRQGAGGQFDPELVVFSVEMIRP